MRAPLMTLIVLGLVSPVLAQEKPPAPKGPPPMIALAAAKEEGGAVVVRVSMLRSETRPQPENGRQGTVMAMVWQEGRPLTLGKQVRAYRPDGKPADAAAVLKALGHPAAAACFVQFTPPGAKEQPLEAPDAFYLHVLRE